MINFPLFNNHETRNKLEQLKSVALLPGGIVLKLCCANVSHSLVLILYLLPVTCVSLWLCVCRGNRSGVGMSQVRHMLWSLKGRMGKGETLELNSSMNGESFIS